MAARLSSRPPGAPEWTAAGAIVLALVAFGLLRVPCDDTLWHLATARVAAGLGHWPTTNTFSWTHPDYPLWQQYPLYQWILFRVQHAGGWEGLSLLSCAGWAAVFAAFVHWGGGARRAAGFHLGWAIALFALQRRMILRPDLGSMLLLAADLLAIDAYLRGRTLAALVPPLAQVAWVNAHQLWPLGLAVQGLWLAHIALARRAREAVELRGRQAPIGPAAAALAVSLLAPLTSPLGVDGFASLLKTWDSVSHHGGDVQEFARIWRSFPERELAILCAAPALWAFWRARRQRDPFEIGLWLGTLALALLAVRGFVYFGITSIAIASRTLARLEPAEPAFAVSEPVRRFLRAAAVCTTILLAAIAVRVRWVAPPLSIGGTQPGLGRTQGDWPDAGIAFLRRARPPGRMMNMPWSLAASVWFLPDVPVFVDPRFESYPRAFLDDAIGSYRDDAALDALIARNRPSWIFAQHCHDGVRARVARLARSTAWRLVHADARTAVLVRRSAETESYLARQPEMLPAAEPEDLLVGPADLRAEQLACWKRLADALGG